MRRFFLFWFLLIAAAAPGAVVRGPLETYGHPPDDPTANLQWQVYRRTDVVTGPAAIVIHAGGFRNGNLDDPQTMINAANDLAEHGFVVYSINYRLDQNTNWIPGQTANAYSPKQSDDCKIAVTAIREDARWDGTKIVVVGGSAGGTHGIIMAGTGALGATRVDGTVALSPPCDYSDRIPSPPMNQFASLVRQYCNVPDDTTVNMAIMLSQSPITLIDANVSPLFIAFSEGDPGVPTSQQDIMVAKLNALGKSNYQSIRVTGAGHAFGNWQLSKTAALAFLDAILAGEPPPPPKPIARIIIGPTRVAAPAAPEHKDWPTGIIYLTGSAEWWDMFEGSPHASLAYDWLYGYRGRSGVNDIIPDSDTVYDWTNIDNVMSVVGGAGKKVGLSFNTGTKGTPRRWYFDPPNPVPYIVVDEVQSVLDEENADATFTSGSNIVTSPKGFFISQDVGKTITASGFISGTTTITSVDSLSQIHISTNATNTSTANATYRIVNRTQLQPVYWNANYRNKYRTFVRDFAARYDGNPALGYVTIQGFMEAGEMYVSKTPAGDVAWDARAVADGYANKSAAYVPAAQGIIDEYETNFRATPCFLTLAKVWDNATTGNADRDAVDNYGRATYPAWYGNMIASVHAVLPVNQTGTLPNRVGYPKIGQAIFSSNDDSRFYSPPMPGSQPADPQPVHDLLTNAAKQGRQAMEVYAADCNNAANFSTFTTDKDVLAANVSGAMAYVQGVWGLSGAGPTIEPEMAAKKGLVGAVVSRDWDDIETDPGVYDWDFIDDFIDNVKADGFDHINVILTDSTNYVPEFIRAELSNRPTITQIGTAGSTTYTYQIVGKAGTAQKGAGNTKSTTSGNATLTGSNKNRLVWVAQTGATSYDIYRTFSGGTPSTTGLIANVTSTLTYDDAGAAGNSATAPAPDGTIPLRDPGQNHSTYCDEIDTPLYWNAVFHQKRLDFITKAGEHFATRSDSVLHGIHCSFANHNSGDWNIQDTEGTLSGPGCTGGPYTVDQPAQWIAAGFTRAKMLQVGKDIITTTATAFPNQNLRLPIGGLNTELAQSGGVPDPRPGAGAGNYSTLAWEILDWVSTQPFADRFYPARNTVDSGWNSPASWLPPGGTPPGFGAENHIKYLIALAAPNSGLQDVSKATGQCDDSPAFRQNGNNPCGGITDCPRSKSTGLRTEHHYCIDERRRALWREILRNLGSRREQSVIRRCGRRRDDCARRHTAAMIFAKPISFERANQTLLIRSLLPTTLSSRELQEISADILDRAFFSSRVHDAEILQEISDVLDEYRKGNIGLAEARLKLKAFLANVSYIPAGRGIQDLTTTARLDLIIETNSAMAAGYGDWLYNQQPAILDQWPAQELFRAAQSKTHRNWRGDDGDIPTEPVEGRWLEAGGTIYDGKMIALRDAAIWTDISRFGTPYPPFDFNSHMRTRLVPRRTAIELGLIDRDARISPQSRRFNETLQSTADVRSTSLRAALRAAGYHFTRDGTLTP